LRFRRLSILGLALLTTSAAGCQIEFTPSLEPLQLATLPPQPFGGSGVKPEADATLAPIPLVLSPQDPGFDPADPAMWIQAIESRWGNVDVITCTDEFVVGCKVWTAEELELLYQVLEDYTFSQYVDQPFNIVRSTSDEYAGIAISRSDNRGNPYHEIQITDRAWRTPPALGVLDAFDILRKEPEHFQGTIAHELTHLAVSFHPELLDWWIEEAEAQSLDLRQRDWRLGFAYDWERYEDYENDTEFYVRRVHEEQFAMVVSGLMYEDSWR
jgi:hypothetical protein